MDLLKIVNHLFVFICFFVFCFSGRCALGVGTRRALPSDFFQVQPRGGRLSRIIPQAAEKSARGRIKGAKGDLYRMDISPWLIMGVRKRFYSMEYNLTFWVGWHLGSG
jgi:hypothetical protein